MDLLPLEVLDVAVLRRILFASVHLPRDLPHYWSTIAQFASLTGKSLQPESVKIAVENLQSVNEKAFATDKQLVKEIHSLCTTPSCAQPLGIILVSPHTKCRLCGGKLLIRSD